MRYCESKQDLLTACGFEYREAEEKWVHKGNREAVLSIERFVKWSYAEVVSWLRRVGVVASQE